MRNIKLTIEYDGTNFQGWQIQKNDSRTVQGSIENALKTIFKKNIKLYGSGRTDSGVHALGQVANFKISTSMSTDEITKALNGNIPKDIAILKTEDVSKDFHAQYSAKIKTYRYTILCRKNRCAQQRNYCLHYPGKLNIRSMKEEAKSLLGEKNFKSFQASDPAKKAKNLKDNTVRTISDINIKRKADLLIIEITANGFLYKMVRNIVGTLLEVGRGKLEKGCICNILAKKDRNCAAFTAKAHGLSLISVKY
ncbi:MAG: tRNA pseudouridine(38-40) synthase TruA [Candidatus Omnitrophica bacterium]|nr:tRNA pseudouridine(38-40) synthase TruA [Candidatus Omnitrophota bacterium]